MFAWQARRSITAGALAATALVLGCGDNRGPNAHWQVVGSKFHEAVLAVAGASESNVWVVGADLGAGPLVLHYDGSAWTRLRTGSSGSLWWAHAFPDGTVFMSGAQSTILMSTDGATFKRMPTPGLASYTVFGVWGRSPTDMYAVGSVSGRNGFVWHYDGTRWADVQVHASLPLAAHCNAPGFFKVWGDQGGQVYVVGDHGVLLREDGTGDFEPVDTGTDGTMFTVSGTGDRAVVVGGANSGEILEVPVGQSATAVGPSGAPLLQGVALDAKGHGWATGFGGTILERSDGRWRAVDTGLTVPDIESLHAVWIDPAGGAWAVGGNVLSTKLDQGAILHWGPTQVATADAAANTASGQGTTTPGATCPADQVDPEPTGSIARRWNEQNLGAIRRDIPRPGVHARNLYHTAAAAWDAWAAYDTTVDGVFSTERATATDVDAPRDEAISYAMYRVLVQRYQNAVGGTVSVACFRAFMTRLGYDPDDSNAVGSTPRALGNRIGTAVIQATIGDGANEAGNYADTTGYQPVNRPLIVDQSGVDLVDPNHWQELNLAVAETQHGIVTPAGVQTYIGSTWANVTPFALTRAPADALYVDPGPVPHWDQPEMQDWIRDLLEHSAALDHTDGRMIDISPGAFGNNTLGTNDGHGRSLNPITGQPYAPNVVPYGDFTRVLGEFWADGPRSETPPGHWFVIANTVGDSPSTSHMLFGSGPVLDRLAWDVHVYLALGGAVHDAAIAAWEVKRAYTAMRPISTVRYLAQLGQSSEPTASDFNPRGLPLEPNLVERVTMASSAMGQRHEALRACVGELAIRTWRGEPGDRLHEVGGVGWLRAVDWLPYQRRTFVTPAFPGFTSGHSTFSRAAAEVLAAITGSPLFPGGLGEFVAPKGEYLVFEDGPSVDVRLQWATYYDAADQAGISRIYGGIHIQPDDFAGRRVGSKVGIRAVTRAKTFFDGTAR